MRAVLLIALVACADDEPTIDATSTPAEDVTWVDVAPVIQERCVACHHPGGVSFSLTTYGDARAQAPALVSAVEAERMPPWAAEETPSCQPPHGFEGDLRVPASDAALLRAWMEADTPEGSPVEPLEPAPVAMVDADDTWAVEQGIVLDEVVDRVICHNIGAPTAADAWLAAAELDPVDRSVAHHAVLLLDESGEGVEPWSDCAGGVGVYTPVVFWAPGNEPFFAPPRSGIPIGAGSQFVVQMHYHPVRPVGLVEPPRALLDWTDGEPDRDAFLEILGNAKNAEQGLRPGRDDEDGPEFRVPAGAVNHQELMEMVLEGPEGWEGRVFGVGHHMHRFGRAMRTRALSGPSEGACLLDTPTWDFDWHRFYRYDAPEEELPILRAGDRLELSCWYDNTLEQEGPRRALSEAGLDAPVDVRLGAGPTDEMCNLLIGLLVER